MSTRITGVLDVKGGNDKSTGTGKTGRHNAAVPAKASFPRMLFGQLFHIAHGMADTAVTRATTSVCIGKCSETTRTRLAFANTISLAAHPFRDVLHTLYLLAITYDT